MKALLYYILNYTFPKLEKDVIKIIKNEKKLVIFDIGCYRGFFTKTFLKSIKIKNYKFYLFDINKNVKRYILKLTKLKNVYYNEIAISNKNGKAKYNYNPTFESSGSSLSSLCRNDFKWVRSRKLILKTLFLNTKDFIQYEVSTITLDSFLKKNKINSVDVIKVDIEGSEYAFLQGAQKTIIKNMVKIVLLEVLAKKNLYSRKEKKIVNFFKKNNYTLFKKRRFWHVSLFSNIECSDCLFISNEYLKKLSSKNII